MKKMKRIAAFFLATVMALAMSCTAFAAGEEFPAAPTTNKEADMTGHRFGVYQIFTGTQTDDEDNGELASIDWGNGINPAELLPALKDSDKFGTSNPFDGINYDADNSRESAQAVAEIMAGWSNKSDEANAFANLAQKYLAVATIEYVYGEEVADDLPAGYYLVTDITEVDGAEDVVSNPAILQLTKTSDFDPEVKADVPVLEKKVNEVNDSEGTSEWGDVADYDIGDEVEFVLTGTLPMNYDDYETYEYAFHDTLSAGLELNESSIKVYVQNKNEEGEYGEAELITDGYVVNTTSETESLIVTFADLKQITSVTADSVIRVKYTASLTEGAVIGGAGNENTAYLEFSNNPNSDGKGKTPEDKVTVFTFKLVANKVDGENQPLEGAGFTLYKYDAEAEDYVAVGDEITGTTEFNFEGIDAGQYKLVETTVPNGYNKADDLEFTVVSTLDPNGNVTALTIKDADGNTIGGTNASEDDSFTINLSEGSLETDVVNQKGIILPSTGGIGTTIFYVVGAILVVGAGVLLITKKRMSKAE